MIRAATRRRVPDGNDVPGAINGRRVVFVNDPRNSYGEFSPGGRQRKQSQLRVLARQTESTTALKTTSISLLERLQCSPRESDWDRLQGIYLPLIRRWLGRVPGLGGDADDLSQEVLIVVIREIPQFDRQREGSFRA